MALETPTVNCPSCGAPVTLRHRNVKLAVCEFCQQTMHIGKDGVDPTGKTATLTDFAPVLALNARGTLRGRGFSAAGRLRFEYDDGYWDEWFLLFDDGEEGWLVEDEGDLTLARKQDAAADAPPFETLRVGQPAMVGGLPLVVTERGEAVIAGGEGQLPLAVRPGERLRYVDGNAGGRTVMVEYTADGIDVTVGEPIDHDDIEVDF